MRLATWNVESIRAHLDQVLAWLEHNEPDVACLQETRADRRKFPVAPFATRGYQVALHGGEHGQGGVAIASRLALDDVAFGIPGAVAPLNEPRSITATVGGIRLHCAYGPNGRKVGTRHHEIKLAWWKLFAAWIEAEGGEFADQLVVGDLNIAPTDLDVWDPHRYRRRNLTSPAERAVFADLCRRCGVVDVVRAELGERVAFSWWNRRSDFYATDRGWRLDHVLATPGVAERVRVVAIDRAERARDGAADHAPILVDLDLSNRAGSPDR